MANEITISVNAQVRNGNLIDQTTSNYRADQNGLGGPTPGALLISTAGEDVTLTDLTTPGLCVVQNIDETNYVEMGVHDGTLFHPFIEIQPGETYVFRFSRNLGEEDDVAGTGTTGTVNTIFARANTAPAWILVKAYEA